MVRLISFCLVLGLFLCAGCTEETDPLPAFPEERPTGAAAKEFEELGERIAELASALETASETAAVIEGLEARPSEEKLRATITRFLEQLERLDASREAVIRGMEDLNRAREAWEPSSAAQKLYSAVFERLKRLLPAVGERTGFLKTSAPVPRFEVNSGTLVSPAGCSSRELTSLAEKASTIRRELGGRR